MKDLGWFALRLAGRHEAADREEALADARAGAEAETVAAEAAGNRRDHDAAERHWRAALARYPFIHHWHEALWHLCCVRGRTDAAIDSLRAMRDPFPHSVWRATRLAYLLDARAAAAEAASGDPVAVAADRREARDTLAGILPEVADPLLADETTGRIRDLEDALAAGQ